MIRAMFPPSAFAGATRVRVIEACNDPGAPGYGQKSGLKSGQKAAPCDPFAVQAEFPEVWSRFIRSNFGSVAQVVAVFHVSERTARKWWDGATGAHGHHLALACRVHPEAARAFLFAAE